MIGWEKEGRCHVSTSSSFHKFHKKEAQIPVIEGRCHKFQQKLKSVKFHLKFWNRDVFGDISQKKEAFLKHNADLDSKELENAFPQEELQLPNMIKGEPQDIVFKEEICWQ